MLTRRCSKQLQTHGCSFKRNSYIEHRPCSIAKLSASSFDFHGFHDAACNTTSVSTHSIEKSLEKSYLVSLSVPVREFTLRPLDHKNILFQRRAVSMLNRVPTFPGQGPNTKAVNIP